MLSKNSIGVALATLWFAGTVSAAELYASTASRAATDSISCRAVNVSDKSLSRVRVELVELTEESPSYSPHVCYDLGSGRTCSNHLTVYDTDRYCKVTVDGGNKRSVRASLTVQDATGETILTLPAE
jgi:hypothetical protein